MCLNRPYYLQPLATLFSGLMILTIGLSEFKKERPFLACFVFVLSGFCIYVGIFTFIS
ncbi:YczI family protein [Shouchella clausii]|uniref:YczI family protein n=1 Tax=Shouchella clausii TaxID=79880 RepID=UPI00311E52B1